MEKENVFSFPIYIYMNRIYINADGTFLFFVFPPNFAVFKDASAFNGDISKWDVSGVTDMYMSTWNDSSIVYF